MSTDQWISIPNPVERSFGGGSCPLSANEHLAAPLCGPGLDPCTEAMTRMLFERDEELKTAVQALEDGRHLLIVGDRWSGKTSFVNAGLLPRFRRRDHLHRRVHAFSLLPSGDDVNDILCRLEQLRLMDSTDESESSCHTHATIRSLAPNAIVVDALEALLDHHDPTRCEQLVEALGARIFKPSGTAVVLAVRSECLEPLARKYPALGRLLAALVHVHVEPLRARRLRRFIESYAVRASVSIDESLVLRLLQDLRPFSIRRGSVASDAAPVMPMVSLLMDALTSTARRHGGRVELQHYHELGGVTGPLVERMATTTQPMASELVCLRQMIAGMARSYFDGLPCTCPVYAVPSRVAEPARAGSGCSVPVILTRVGIDLDVEIVPSESYDSYFLRHDVVLRFWPLAQEWLAEAQLRSSEPLRSVMSLYVRTGWCSFRTVDRSMLALEPRDSGELALVKKLRRDRWWWRVRSFAALSSLATLGLALFLLASRGASDEVPRCEWDGFANDAGILLAEALQLAQDRLVDDASDSRYRARLARAEISLHLLRNGGRRTSHVEALEHRLLAEQAMLKSGCDAALPHFRADISITRKALADRPASSLRSLLHAYQRVATCHNSRGRRHEALVALTELLDTITTANDQGAVYLDDDSRQQLAQAFHARSRLVEGSEAINDRVAALELYEAIARPGDAAAIEATMTLHLELGELYMAAGDRPAAKRSYEALIVLDAQRDPKGRTHERTLRLALGRLSEIAALTGDFARAREHLQQELDATWSSVLVAPSDAGRRDVASVFLRLGRLELELGNRDAARTRLLQGLSAVLEMKDLYDVFDDGSMKTLLTEDLATYLGVLGELEQQDGNLDAARGYYERALQLLRQRVLEDPESVGSQLSLADSLERLADLWMALDEPEQASSSLEVELKLLRGLLHEQGEQGSSRADLVHRLAWVHIDALHASLAGGSVEAGGAHLEAARVLVASLEPSEQELLAERYVELVDAIDEMEMVMSLPIEGLRANDP